MTAPLTAEQALVQLQQQMQQQQQFMTQQQQQIEQLTAQISSNNSNNNNASHDDEKGRPSNPKIVPTKPDTYNGQRRGTPADVWLFGLEQYFTATVAGGAIWSDEFKVNFAAAQLRDSAATWWRRQLQMTHNTSTPSIATTTSSNTNTLSWKQFKEAFLKQFLPIATKDTARATLHNLKQRTSVAGYCDAFNTVLIQLDNDDMSEADQLFLFKRGLNKDMSQNLLLLQPKTLPEAMALAVRLEAESQNQFRHMYQQRGGGNWNNSHNHNNNNSNQHQQRTTSTPMELGRMQDASNNDTDVTETNDQEGQTLNATTTTSRRLTPAQVEDYKRKGLCFNCGTHGHLSRQCPTKNQVKPQAQQQPKK
jgi:hypothetical protein